MKSIKQYLLLLSLLAAVILPLHATKPTADNIDSLFNEFSKVENAEYVNIRPFCMKILGMFGAHYAGPDGRIVKKIKSIKVLDLEASPEIYKTKLCESLSSMHPKGFEELMTVNEGEEHLRIFGEIKKDCIRKLIIHCTDRSDCVLISLSGRFKKEDISDVVKSTTKKKNGIH